MDFAIFEESYYLANNPDVAAAVADGFISSGLQHFLDFGQQEGRTKVSPLFSEQFYLANNTDVAAAVADGFISSGLQHFLNFGQQEGRTNVSPLYNEQFYLANNTDVAAAVDDGFISSGLQHFLNFGQQEGRTNVSPLFNEQFYLANNTDVAAAVADGFISSGLQHFLDFGLQEGRNSISSEYDENSYLSNNPDIGAAVSTGLFASGLEHLLLFGATENRIGAPEILPEIFVAAPAGFNEDFYLLRNPDVEAAVTAGVFGSGLNHYEQFGQFEQRNAIFSGTSGNDVVTGFGRLTIITGVGIETLPLEERPTSLGVGEVDTLIGGEGTDGFLLSFPPSRSNLTPQQFYIGNGDNDFARIQNFERAEDGIVLTGSPDDYSFGVENGSFNISTNSGDLIGIVEGVGELEVTESFPSIQMFFLS